MMLGYQASYFRAFLLLIFLKSFFLSIRSTDQITGNAFDAKRKQKKREWPYAKFWTDKQRVLWYFIGYWDPGQEGLKVDRAIHRITGLLDDLSSEQLYPTIQFRENCKYAAHFIPFFETLQLCFNTL